MFSSLRWKFTAWYVGASLLILVIVGLAIFLLESRAISHRIDGSIKSGGDAVKGATITGMRTPGSQPIDLAKEAVETVVAYPWLSAHDVFVVLLDRDGKIVANPEGVSAAALSGPDSLERSLRTGVDWRTVELVDSKLRVKTFPLLDNDGTVIGFVQAGKSVDDSDAALQTLLLVLGGSGLVGLALSAVGGYVVAGKAIRPVQQSYERQRQFVSDASHELRTPLSVIRTNAGVLARRDTTDPSIQDIETETRYMSRLLDNLLLLANGDRGALETKRLPLDLAEVVRSMEQSGEALAAEARVQFRIQAEDELPVVTDPDRVRQAVYVLLDNAIRFTPADGDVVLTTRRDGLDAVVEVLDSGPGMTREDLSRATDRFFSGNRARTRLRGGAGLGLSIAKELMTALGGRLELDSEPGGGTTARLRLPLASTTEQTATTAALRPETL